MKKSKIFTFKKQTIACFLFLRPRLKVTDTNKQLTHRQNMPCRECGSDKIEKRNELCLAGDINKVKRCRNNQTMDTLAPPVAPRPLLDSQYPALQRV